MMPSDQKLAHLVWGSGLKVCQAPGFKTSTTKWPAAEGGLAHPQMNPMMASVSTVAWNGPAAGSAPARNGRACHRPGGNPWANRWFL